MRWLKRDIWRAGIALAGLLLLLALMVWVPVSAAGAYEGASGLATPVTGTVQATPTVDATVTALNKEKLTQEVAQQQHTWENWLWSNAGSVSSALVIVLGALFGLWRWLGDRRSEREKRAEERFQAAVEGLGREKEEAKAGAAIVLRSFLRPGYEQFYTQTFDLAVAHLRLRHLDPDIPEPLTSLSQALVIVFKESFPLARSRNQGDPQSLDATGIQLDNAYLLGVDLKQAWMRRASLRNADLIRATLSSAHLFRANLSGTWLWGSDLSGADLREANLSKTNLRETDFRRANLKEANLSGADLHKANLIEADLRGADLHMADLDVCILKDTDLRGVKGLTKEQLEACKAKGAIIDEDTTTSPPQSPVPPPAPLQSTDTQVPSVPPAQVSTPTPDTDRSTTPSSKPGNGTQAPSAPPVQESMPTSNTDRSSAPSSSTPDSES